MQRSLQTVMLRSIILQTLDFLRSEPTMTSILAALCINNE